MVSRLVRSGYQQHEAEGEVEHLRGMQLLHFEFIRNDVSEQSLLFLSPDTPREQLVTFARDCFFKGWSIRDIAAHTALSKSSIHRLLAQPKLPQQQQQQPQSQPQQENQQPQEQQPQEPQPQEPQPQEPQSQPQEQQPQEQQPQEPQSQPQDNQQEKKQKTVPPTESDDLPAAPEKKQKTVPPTPN
ncbi:MAG: helix-turn-helix domain-containing protein, partial [Muribaculaceae bacterium]|nr:helix-turn-helix domain-containing protein [Muribaculaceae bacterium]